MRAACLASLALCLATVCAGAPAKDGGISGLPEIVDGDTVRFDAVRLRLDGIDAPQMDQKCFDKTGAEWKCGIEARAHLKLLAGGRTWRCEPVRKNHYGRLFAKCWTGDRDIGQDMVRDGWALASTTGVASYLADEQKAKASAAGLWQGAFVAPLDWRQHNWHAKVLGQAAVDKQMSGQLLTSAFAGKPPSRQCAIKGNVNTSGECIFHKPGGRWYMRITMEPQNGDRWFCSPIEAIASGCRETRR